MKKLFILFAVLLPCFVFVSCGDEDDEDYNITSKSFTMYAHKSQAFNYSGEWVSSNPLIAYVKEGKLHSGCIGEATISQGKTSFKVSVIPYYGGIYNEPCLEWGASMSKVKSFMSGYTLYDSSSTTLAYKGKLKEKYITYMFENSRLVTSGVFVPLSCNAEDLIGFLSERYVYVGKQTGYYTFFTLDQKTIIMMDVSEKGYYSIVYIDFETASNGTNKFEFKDLEID